MGYATLHLYKAPATRDAVRLRVIDELPYRDLAQRLCISETQRACACRAGCPHSPRCWTRTKEP